MIDAALPKAGTASTAGGWAPLATFFALAFGLTWGPLAIATRGDMGQVGWGVVLLLVSAFGPGVAAVVAVLAFEGRAKFGRWIARCLRWRVGWGWALPALFLPPVLVGLALGLNVATGGTLRAIGLDRPALALLVHLGLTIVAGGPLGEEFGWRGYALPALTTRIGWRWASVVLGAVWALWHVPLFLMPGTVQADPPMTVFAAGTVALSVILARLSVQTGFSVLPAIVLHASVNWTYEMLPVMPVAGDMRVYLIVNALMVLTAGVVLLLPGPPEGTQGNPR